MQGHLQLHCKGQVTEQLTTAKQYISALHIQRNNIVFVFFQEVFSLTLWAMWAKAARDVQMVHLLHLTKHLESIIGIASHVLQVRRTILDNVPSPNNGSYFNLSATVNDNGH